MPRSNSMVYYTYSPPGFSISFQSLPSLARLLNLSHENHCSCPNTRYDPSKIKIKSEQHVRSDKKSCAILSCWPVHAYPVSRAQNCEWTIRKGRPVLFSENAYIHSLSKETWRNETWFSLMERWQIMKSQAHRLEGFHEEESMNKRLAVRNGLRGW